MILPTLENIKYFEAGQTFTKAISNYHKVEIGEIVNEIFIF